MIMKARYEQGIRSQLLQISHQQLMCAVGIPIHLRPQEVIKCGTQSPALISVEAQAIDISLQMLWARNAIGKSPYGLPVV
jgi:hypothetical protein